MSEEEYRRKAWPWPLNQDGELVLWAIVESKKGIANIREIAQVPGLAVIVVGAGTLGGVFSSTCSHPANNPAEIEALKARGFSVFTMQARNQAGFDAIAAGHELSRCAGANLWRIPPVRV